MKNKNIRKINSKQSQFSEKINEYEMELDFIQSKAGEYALQVYELKAMVDAEIADDYTNLQISVIEELLETLICRKNFVIDQLCNLTHSAIKET